LFIAVIALTSVADAATKSWSLPSGQFTVAIPDAWVQIPPTDVPLHTNSVATLLVTPQSANPKNPQMGCGIYKLDHIAAGELTQTAVNSVLLGWNQNTLMEQARAAVGGEISVQNFSNSLRKGVQVVTFEFMANSDGSRLRHSQIQFMLAMSGTATSFFTVGCFAPATASEADFKKISTFLSSLTFQKARLK
jgi:hypothetical protein